MKAFILISGLLGMTAAHADDASWILQPELTPTRLADDGALLTASDAVRWPDGPSVDISYWLGAGDIVYRCAALSSEGATSASCWRQQLVAGHSADGSRRMSTRQRRAPVTSDYSQSFAIQPYVWMEGMPSSLPRRPEPRPQPLPTP